ncbi:hypothetical protein CDD83_6478 [Cordyceps sp. RAO-2017]|nr:hypothetical protein CDD83_6478 [Cordyceps sp. RAO-2017]
MGCGEKGRALRGRLKSAKKTLSASAPGAGLADDGAEAAVAAAVMVEVLELLAWLRALLLLLPPDDEAAAAAARGGG